MAVQVGRRRACKVLHLFDAIGNVKGSVERALRLSDEAFKVAVCSFYNTDASLSQIRQTTPKQIVGLGASSRWSPRACWRLFRWIADARPDILHTHHNWTGILGALIGRLTRVPIIINATGTTYTRYSLPVRLIKRMAMSLAHVHVFVSEAARDAFGGTRRFREKGRVIHNGVCAEAVMAQAKNASAIRRELGLASDRRVVGTIGRLKEVKDQSTLLRAIFKLAESGKAAQLALVGTGPMEAALRKEAETLGIGESVLFLGDLPRETVYGFLHAIDLYAMASTAEGLSGALLEAMAARRPVVVTDIPSFREVVEDGVTGVLVPRRDPDAMARAISRMLSNEDEADRMGQRAQETVRRDFRLDETVGVYEELYVTLLKKGCRQHAEG